MSRIALRQALCCSAWGRPLRVPIPVAVLARKWSSSAPKWQGERDLVNFPDYKHPEMAKVRLGFIPDEWFTALHSKTGASGPYMLLTSVTTFLLSKEIWVMEHDFYCGIALFIVYMTFIKKFGPATNELVQKEFDKEDNRLMSARLNEIQRCKDAIQGEEKAQWMATSYEELLTAKRENVALQLEAAYRERLNHAYNQVRRRLDYQLEVSNVMRRVEQQHMVDWIISSVKKSITAKQEEDALKKCVADLKAMAK